MKTRWIVRGKRDKDRQKETVELQALKNVEKLQMELEKSIKCPFRVEKLNKTTKQAISMNRAPNFKNKLNKFEYESVVSAP